MVIILVRESIYASSNGDCWWLIRDTEAGSAFVRHEANPASGGHATEVTVEEFLALNGPGPEYAALRRLTEQPGAAQATSGPSVRYRPRRARVVARHGGA